MTTFIVVKVHEYFDLGWKRLRTLFVCFVVLYFICHNDMLQAMKPMGMDEVIIKIVE